MAATLVRFLLFVLALVLLYLLLYIFMKCAYRVMDAIRLNFLYMTKLDLNTRDDLIS
jgi:hypothetical protein